MAIDLGLGLIQLIATVLFGIAVAIVVMFLPRWFVSYRARFAQRADQESRAMNLLADTNKLFAFNVVLLVAAPVVTHLALGIWWVSLTAFALASLFPAFIWPRVRKRRLAKIEAQLPDAFITLANTLQSGASLNTALSEMADVTPTPLKGELKWLIRRLKLGASLDDALLMLERRIPSQGFVMASSAIRISREVGGNLVVTISTMAETLRRKTVMDGKVDSLTSQGKAQGRLMSFMPILIGVGLFFLEPEAMEKLYTTPIGMLVLGFMIAMQILGMLWINRITTIDS